MITPGTRDDVQHAWHLYVIQLNLDRLRITRNEFIEHLKEKKIGTSVHPSTSASILPRYLRIPSGGFPQCQRRFSMDRFPSRLSPNDRCGCPGCDQGRKKDRGAIPAVMKRTFDFVVALLGLVSLSRSGWWLSRSEWTPKAPSSSGRSESGGGFGPSSSLSFARWCEMLHARVGRSRSARILGSPEWDGY